jgi:exopolyphosphatase/pppGpp-phosphohydrolase
MTYDPTYSPFPELELTQLAAFHDSVAKHHPERSYLRAMHEDRATVCRNAVAAHDALRTRFLEQSMLVRALQSVEVA